MEDNIYMHLYGDTLRKIKEDLHIQICDLEEQKSLSKKDKSKLEFLKTEHKKVSNIYKEYYVQ